MDRPRFVYKKYLNIPWLFTMAWRDSRRNRSRLFLFMSSIILGIAALVATFSFGDNLQQDIDKQAKTLVGADLIIESNKPVSPKMKSFLDTLGNRRSQERTFASMVYFTKNQGTRLVQVRALEGDYPYYGNIETLPVEAGREFRKGRKAIADKTLMLQFNAAVGDSIQIGEVTFEIAGSIEKAPGRTGLSTTIAPPVYIPLRFLEQTGLTQKGSRIGYNFYFLFDSTRNVDRVLSSIERKLEEEGLDYETVESRKKNTSRSFEDFARFLTLISFIALLLGCIGVASSVHIYMKEKLSSIAILRCLGVNGSQAFIIYLIQITGIGLLGSLIGAGLGTVVHQLLPLVLKELLPVEISTNISWHAIGMGVLTGMILSLLFALSPLVSVRNISPLYTLRMAFEEGTKPRDLLRWIIYAVVLAFIFGFTWWQIKDPKEAAFFTGSIVAAFFFLTAVAWLLRWVVHRFFPTSWNYLWRQGFANLYRPNNQTLILIVTIGLGVSFIGTLYFVQDILMNRVSLSASGNQPNIVLFDIQSEQRAGISSIVKKHNLPLIQQVPIVTMRIEEINGKTAADVRKDTSLKIPVWAFEGELRVTYRDSLTNTEKITMGKLTSHMNAQNEPIYISIEDRYANRLNVKIGDQIVFNAQGALIPTAVGSFREVDWNRIQTNFRVVFPTGVLENAPQFHVIVSRVPSSEASAQLQQEVVRRYPNISIIDLGLILSVLDDVLSKIAFVIRFMAAFSIITGLIVLIASVLISKYQRIQESVLLRTLGANRKQILTISALEYLFLGVLASATGIILALGGSWALAKYNFETTFKPQLLPILAIFLIISALIITIGLFNSREVLNKPPLEVLRKEV